MALTQNRVRMTDADHVRITDAIRKAEGSTSGEIFAVVAHRSDDYFHAAGFIAALWSLLIGFGLATVSHLSGFKIPVISLAAAQLVSFAVSLFIFWYFPDLRLWFVPRSIAYRRASRNAVRQFLAHGIHTTADRSGILIFVSLAERYAEIVADAGIHRKVDQILWDDLMGEIIDHAKEGRITDGFVHVIERAGGVLAEHFPPTDDQKNELDDRLVEI